MKFINHGESIKIRVGKLKNFYWITVRKNEIVELPQSIGKNHGLEELKTTEGQIGDKKVETKQIEVPEKINISGSDNSFYNELIKIKGIALKTAEDIIEVFTKEELIKSIINKEKLPFRNDVELKLRKKYG